MTTDDATTAADIMPNPARRAKPTSATAAKPATPTKSDTVIKLLLRTKGATPIELIAATDWQSHSVRAFLSGLRKKGRVIVRDERKNGELAYHVVAAATSPQSPEAAAGSAINAGDARRGRSRRRPGCAGDDVARAAACRVASDLPRLAAAADLRPDDARHRIPAAGTHPRRHVAVRRSRRSAGWLNRPRRPEPAPLQACRSSPAPG